MRIIGVAVVLCLLMAGCAASPVFEEVGDVFDENGLPEPKNTSLSLPEETAVQTISGDNGTLYLCDGFEVTRQVLKGGSLDRTLRELSGYSEERLTVLVTDESEGKRYSCVWSSAGESGDTVGRAVILDDGAYHYCLTVMAPAETAGRMHGVWNQIMNSYSFS